MIKRRRSDDRPADDEPSLELPPDDSSEQTRATDSASSTPAGDSPGPDQGPPPPDETGSADAQSDSEHAGGEHGSGRSEGATDADADRADGGRGDSAAGSAPPPERRRRGGGVAVLALLLALAAAAAAGWAGWRLMQVEQRLASIPDERAAALEPLASEQAALARRVDGLGGDLERRVDQQIGSVEQRLAGLEDERAAALDRMRQRLQTAETAIRSLREQRERTGVDWRMAEVRYLVSVAANRLRITGDVPGAVAALQAADGALARVGDPRVLDLRERLVERIGSLEQVEPADVAGIALRVQNLAPHIPQLVAAGTAPAPDGTENAGGAQAAGGEEGWWAAIRGQLGELVSVRREPGPSPPDAAARAAGPVPSAELPAAERLLLALEDASRAALNHDPRAYDDALGRALALLESEYDPNAPPNRRFREALTALSERRVTTDLPDLGPLVERTEALATRLSGSGPAAQGGS